MELINLDQTNTPRRTIVKAAAWSVPVIAMAVSVPAASASGECAPGDAYTLAVCTSIPSCDSLGTIKNSKSHIKNPVGYSWNFGPNAVFDFQVTYTNNGPAAMPAGGRFSIYIPVSKLDSNNGFTAGDIWRPSPAITGSRMSIGGTPAISGFALERSYDVAYDKSHWNVYTGTLQQALPAGQSFTVYYQVKAASAATLVKANGSQVDYRTSFWGAFQGPSSDCANQGARVEDGSPDFFLYMKKC